MIHVEGYGNWYASSESLDPFVCVHVEEKSGLDGMELLFAVALVWDLRGYMEWWYEKEEGIHSNGAFFYVGKRYAV